MKTVAIYGGSFNPVHLGHVMVVCWLNLMEPSVDEIVIPVCYEQTGKSLAPFHHRYQMCRMAFDGIPNVTVSDIEEELSGESISLRTVRELAKSYPGCNFRFVMGSDLVEFAPTWEGWEDLVQEAPPLILPRGEASFSNVSSTKVRKAIQTKDWKAFESFLPKRVSDYILRYNLYVDG